MGEGVCACVGKWGDGILPLLLLHREYMGQAIAIRDRRGEIRGSVYRNFRAEFITRALLFNE